MEFAKSVRDPIHQYMATMFTPVITWDANQLAIAKRMTDAERMVIAKRATHLLREYLPEVLSCFTNFWSIREAFAEHRLLNRIDKEELLTLEASIKNKRNYALSRQRTEDIDEIVQLYRTQAGYRAACLVLLIPDSAARKDARLAFDVLRALSDHQHILFQGLLLRDLLRWIMKHHRKYPKFDFESHTQAYCAKLQDRNASLRTTIEAQSLVIERFSPVEYLSGLSSLYFTMDDPVLRVVTEFSALVSCFERMNEQVSASIASCTERIVAGNQEWSLSRFATDQATLDST